MQEWIVRRSKLDWVIVRPVILTGGPKTNAYRQQDLNPLARSHVGEDRQVTGEGTV